jgi:hypothetical protein
MTERNRLDRELLFRVLDHPISAKQRDAFLDMAEGLDGSPTLHLSTAQRAWVTQTIRTHEPTYVNAFSAGHVPRGNEVPTPPALQNLPKRPPHRRHEES